MRKMLFLLLCFPLLLLAQRDEFDVAYYKSIPPGLGKSIRLPERDYNPHFDIHDWSSYDIKQKVFIINTDSVYRKLFWRYVYTDDSLKKYGKQGSDEWSYKWMVRHHVDSLPVIDFAKKELVMYTACAQCLAYCEHNDDNNESCHRNVCNFRESWFLRDKLIDVQKETGERRNFLDALYGYKPDTISKPVILPFVWRTEFRNYFEVGHKSSYLYHVSDSMYQKIFDWYLRNDSKRMPAIDFSKQELWVRIACHQCLISCNAITDYWRNTPCHRNACRYSYSWFVKEKSAGN